MVKKHNKLTVSYIYVDSQFWYMSWKETIAELFVENREVIE